MAYEDELDRILCGPLKHTTLCLEYYLEEHPHPGRFRPETAQAYGVPCGPLWGKLHRGGKVTLENGITISPDQVVGPPRPGRCICYAVDTRPTHFLYQLCQDVDIAFLDGMFLPEHCQEAEAKEHMTVDEAVRIASEAGARRVVLVHISPRYKEDEEGLARAASHVFSNAEVGRDLQWITVPYRED